MPITLHSLFEITESSTKDFIVYWDNKRMIINHNQLADVEKHFLINLYVYNIVSESPNRTAIYECVALPYNYGKGVM